MKWIATFFGSGYSPICPGTAGSLAAVPLLFLFSDPWLSILAAILLFFLGRSAAEQYAKEQQDEDPKQVVIDEVVGMLVTMAFVPITWLSVLAGFLLFRLFDITKPLGIRKLEPYPNGWGIMLDDLLAGVYANILLRVLLYFI